MTLEDGDQLWFEHCGSGKPLFLISGLGGCGDFWTTHLDRLAQHFLVVVHDHRGTGASSRRPIQFSIAQMSSDVIALADHIGVDSLHVVGHSTGGAIAQTLALDHPDRVRSLVLSATWAGRDGYIDSLFSLRRDVLEQMGLTAYQRLANIMLKPPNAFADLFPSVPDVQLSGKGVADDAQNISGRIRALLEFDRRDDLHRIKQPTLISCAEDDVIIPPHCSRELHQLISGSSLKVYSSGGHAYSNVLADEFSTDLLTFFTRHDVD